jgi:hypothetical protein
VTTDLAELYRQDFYAWALSQAQELRRLAETRPNAAIDFENLIEEVEGLASSNLNTVLSQLTRLIHHLLKLEHSPTPLPRRKWLNTIDDARDEILPHFSPSMRGQVDGSLDQIFRSARRAARRDLLDHNETQAAAALPEANPYALDRLLDEGWYPDNRHGLVDET